MANQTQQATREFDVVRFMQMYQKAQRLSPEAYGYLCGVIDFLSIADNGKLDFLLKTKQEESTNE
jgi:hypothetical protein